MALRTILKKDTDEESLRKKSRPVTVFDQRLHNMIDDMVDTLKDSGSWSSRRRTAPFWSW